MAQKVSEVQLVKLASQECRVKMESEALLAREALLVKTVRLGQLDNQALSDPLVQLEILVHREKLAHLVLQGYLVNRVGQVSLAKKALLDQWALKGKLECQEHRACLVSQEKEAYQDFL